MNETITALGVVKTTIDISLYRYVAGGNDNDNDNGAFLSVWGQASPWIEFAISAAWMLPTLWAVYLDQSVQTIVSVISNVSFNLTGLFGIFGTLPLDPVSKAVYTGVIVATIAVYGRRHLRVILPCRVKTDIRESQTVRQVN